MRRRTLISVVIMIVSVGLCILSDIPRYVIIALILLYGGITSPSPPDIGPTPTWPATEQREGRGNSLEMFGVSVDGNMGFISSHLGDEGAFQVLVKDGDGNVVQAVADCYGECKDEAYVFLPAGNYTLEVAAQERWYIILGSP